ncbi:MAG: hypothetical protein RL021_293 [Bacteroidota bacterium]|jgi:hypothetical protein
MRNHYFFSLIICITIKTAASQQWGAYTLYSVQNQTAAYLCDTNGTTFHTWSGLTGGTGYSSYMMPGGTLVRTVRNTGNVLNGGGMTGRVQKVSYSGSLLWDFTYSSSTYCLHHDICPLPNGNVLMISYDVKTAADLTAAGYAAAGHTIWSEKIIEVQPSGPTTGTIVWEWKLWDHLTQNVDPARANYNPTVIDHPELMNVNFQSTSSDWIHMNGIDWDSTLDQIVVSSHNLNEVYVIDHSTTTAEAAGHTGGNSGKGGDFLYRWGNPAAYGAAGSRIFNVVHDAHFVPADCPRAGYIVGYNNGGITSPTQQSCADLINPPRNGYNFLINPGSAYAPTTYDARIPCGGYNSNMGNSQQLPNGNSLVCIAQSGTIKEFDINGTLLWTKNAGGTAPQAFRYSACYLSGTPPATPAITDSVAILTTTASAAYQWFENGVPIAGANSQNFIPTHNGNYEVAVRDLNGCWSDTSASFPYIETGVVQVYDDRDLTVYPNPSSGLVELSGGAVDGKNFTATIIDQQGRTVRIQDNTHRFDLTSAGSGIYTLTVRGDHVLLNKRIIIAQ